LLSIRAASGAVTAFSVGDGDAGRRFYDRWFSDHGWTAAARWEQVGLGWHARFETRSQRAIVAVDIRLGTDAQSRWTGLIVERQGPE